MHLALPPLRERAEDVPQLVDSFLEAHARVHGVAICEVSSDAMAALVDCRRPGNVRQLEDVVERLALLAQEPFIALGDLPAEVLVADWATPALTSV